MIRMNEPFFFLTNFFILYYDDHVSESKLSNPSSGTKDSDNIIVHMK